MWTRIGAFLVLSSGLLSMLLQGITLQANPLLGVALTDVGAGAIGIYASSFTSSMFPINLYLLLFIARGLLPIAFFSAFFVMTKNPSSILSGLLCGEVGHVNAQEHLTAAEKEALHQVCEHATVVIVILVAFWFLFSLTCCWFPCFRCALHLRESLKEREALEGLLDDVEGDEDEQLREFMSQSISRRGETSITVVTPPMGVIDDDDESTTTFVKDK